MLNNFGDRIREGRTGMSPHGKQAEALEQELAEKTE
jgi:hypothetical protein